MVSRRQLNAIGIDADLVRNQVASGPVGRADARG